MLRASNSGASALRASIGTVALIATLTALVGQVTPSAQASADVGVKLPLANFYDLVIDEEGGHVFVSGGLGSSEILVMDFDATLAATVGDVPRAAGMVLIDQTLYAVAEGRDQIYKVDAVTLEKTGSIELDVTAWGTLGVGGGRLWFAHSCGSFGSQVASVDLSTEVVTMHTGDFGCGLFASSPVIPDALFMAGSSISRYDISVDPPALVAKNWASDMTNIQDVAVMPDGQGLLVTASAPYEIRQLSASDLKPTGFTYPLPPYPDALAVGPSHVVGGVHGIYEPDVHVFPAGDPTPSESVDFDGTPGPYLYPRGVGITEDEARIFAVTGTSIYGGDAYFHSLYGPAIKITALTLATSKGTIGFGKSAKLTAHLDAFAQSSNKKVSIYKEPINGTKTLLTSGLVDGDGDLTVKVSPSKNTKYTATWAGEADWRPAESNSRTVRVKVITTGKLLGAYGKQAKYHLYDEGDDPIYKGKVVPNHAGNKLVVVLEVRFAGKWKSLGKLKATLGKKSSVFIELVDPAGGYSFRIRGWFSHGEDHAKDGSPWAYFKVVA
ncbi:MAG: hypothetical protein ACRDI0_06575 [Actinomycetota bacterium]